MARTLGAGRGRCSYPSFVDAVRDLDDALCMLFLFARMPQTDKLKAETSLRCARLCAEFQHYVIATQSLRKVFLSIKGLDWSPDAARDVRNRHPADARPGAVSTRPRSRGQACTTRPMWRASPSLGSSRTRSPRRYVRRRAGMRPPPAKLQPDGGRGTWTTV